MNSECKVSINCRKSSTDTYFLTTLVCQSMIILHIFSVFIRDYYQPLMSVTKVVSFMKLVLKCAILWFWGFEIFTLFYSVIFKLSIYWGKHSGVLSFFIVNKKFKNQICAVQTVAYHRFISLGYLWNYGTTIRLWFMIYFFFLSNNIIWTVINENTQKLVENVQTNCNSYTNICTTSKTEKPQNTPCGTVYKMSAVIGMVKRIWGDQNASGKYITDLL